MILLDTNYLARLTSKAHPHSSIAAQSIQKLLSRGERIVIVPQNLFEFWAVATRSAGIPPAGQNGLGMTSERTSLWINYFQRRFALLSDRAELTALWHQLVKTHNIRGLKSHDARLAAAMQSHGITDLLTFNPADFKPFGLKILNPQSI
jgi:predicted nucleic acid-binding protein